MPVSCLCMSKHDQKFFDFMYVTAKSVTKWWGSNSHMVSQSCSLLCALFLFIPHVCNCLQPHHNFARGDLVENLQQCATKLDVLLTTLGLKKQAHPPPLHKVDSEKVHTPCYYSIG